jgi:hypothetical protein
MMVNKALIRLFLLNFGMARRRRATCTRPLMPAGDLLDAGQR